MEPVQGEAGVIPANDDFMCALRELADSTGILLIVDEVQTGVGRTGKLFAYEWSGIIPDIMTIGKGIGGGVPLAGLLAREAVCCFSPGDQGGTYNGNPLMTAVGCAVMTEITKPGFLDHVNQISEYLRDQLAAMSRLFQLGEVRGARVTVGIGNRKSLRY